MFRHTISAIFRRYYDNVKGKNEEGALPFTMLLKSEIIILVQYSYSLQQATKAQRWSRGIALLFL
jgi:hypothetical protein